MEPVRDPYVQYSELLVKVFEKIQKTLPRKFKELKELCTEAIEKVKLEKDGPYDANKYFYILKLALDTKIPKLMEHILYIIQKLISYEFLDGNCEDNCIYPEDQKPPANNGRLPRRLIDAIVESICNCALLTVVTTFNSKVHEKSLLEAFRACYQIHITSTNSINQNTAKASLTQMINIVFSKMEAYSGNFGMTLKQLQQRNAFMHNHRPNSIEDGELSMKGGSGGSDKSLQIKKQGTSIEEEKMSTTIRTETSGGQSKQNDTLINFNASDQYIFQVVQNMVDDVCLYDARQDQIKSKYMSQLNNLENSTDLEERQALEEMMRNELSGITLRSVPLKVSKEEGKVKKQIQVDIKNEHEIQAGKFGWCIVCRNQANLYCKDTRHPVCSYECKQKHVNLIDSIQAPQIEGLPNFHNTEEARRYFTDALTVFKSICKLCLKEIPNQNINTFTMRSKILGLELILAVVEKPGTTFLNRKEFIDIIKDTLCDGLRKYSVSNEKTIFSTSISIFYYLFLHFREHLKQEIVVFIETIFLKILESGNSNYHHKYLILTIFDKISQNTKHQLEIFINYDGDPNQKDIFERIIDSLSKIAQGKFQKSEHANIITPQEEYSLRLYALQIIVQMLRNISKTIEAENTEFKIAHKEMSASAKRESSVDNHSDDEEQKEEYQKSSTIDNLEKNRQVKNDILKASIKFNFKPKNGINFLLQQNMIAKEPQEQQIKDIVHFLKTSPNLDKTAIGDYLGEFIDLNLKVLQEYINQFSFEDMPFVDAMKRMLAGFRLPPEGQKVDRIMEIFGEKYCKDNHDIFGNAEACYVLAYATMILQTSLHNPQAQKTRMTIDDYLKMLKGVNNGKDIDRDFLVAIYHQVETEPFTLTEDEEARIKLEGKSVQSFKQKEELLKKEQDHLLKVSGQQIKQKNVELFKIVDDTEGIRPMFEAAWSATLAVFSVLLEESDDVKITDLCIEGFTHAIKIAGFYNLNTERDAFVGSLSKFTQVSAIKEIKEKNIECIRALLNLATYEGNYLKNSWYYVLDCISKIDYMHVLGTGARKDSEFFNAKQKGGVKNVQLQRKLEREQALIQNSELIVQHIDFNKIDLIIQRSVNLDSDAIIDFITNLCLVSREELNDVDNPRKFSLQRIVEVADFNMGRIRFVWTKIWQTLSEHFGTVGSHPNLNVALYAIDSLRQLADKFLLKDEFGHYNFQKDFLKPFETIMLNNLHTRLEVKEFIVMAVANMCRAKSKYIKSGWIIIINIFTLAAQDSEEHLVFQSFEALKQAVKTQFTHLEDNFVELVNCLNKYTKNNFHKQSLEALDLIQECAKNLSQKKEIIQNFIKLNGINFYQRDRETMLRYPSHYGLQKQSPAKEEVKSARSSTVSQMISEEQPDESKIRHSVQKGLWFPILTNLTNLIMEKRKDIQEKAFTVLFIIFNEYNQDFTFEFWREILNQIILPVLEDIHLAVEIPNKNTDSEFYKTTIHNLLEKMNTFIVTHIDTLRGLVPDYIDMLALFISNINEKHIAQVVISQFKAFIVQVGKSISPNQWNAYVISLQNLFDATVPTPLIEEKERFQDGGHQAADHHQQLIPKQRHSITSEQSSASRHGADLPFNQDACFTKCIVQLLLISTVSDTVDKFYDYLSLHNLYILLECLDKSYKFAKEFNQELGLRLKLWNDGFMADLKQLPGLTAQERESISTYLQILFKMYFQSKEGQNIDTNSKKLFELCSKVLKDYCLQQSELVAINSSKQEENTRNGGPNASNESEEAEGEEKQLSLSNLHENELERQLQNITPIVSNIILANLLKLSEDDLKKHVRDIGPLLIDLSLCNHYEIRLANKELLSRIFDFLVTKVY